MLIGYAVPGFLFAILLVVLFAGGSFVQWFPLRGLHSMGTENWSLPARIVDYLWHMVLPTVALVVGGFAGLTVLTKNCFLEEIRKQYVVTARAKGASEQRILYRHVFRNAMLLIIAGFPSAFIGILFSPRPCWWRSSSRSTASGCWASNRRSNATTPSCSAPSTCSHLLGLLMQIVGDVLYTVVDPRIDFEARQ